MAICTESSSNKPKSVTVYVVDAFVHQRQGGNPAGVVLVRERISDRSMQMIAQQMGLSETAFVFDIDHQGYSVRFFTPTQEVDFCGHATLAVAHHLYSTKQIQAGTYLQQTKAGTVAVKVESSEKITMQQRAPQFGQEFVACDVRPLFLTPDVDFVEQNLKIQVVDTGLPDLLLPVKRGTLNNLTINQQAMSSFCQQHELASIHVFELCDEQDCHAAHTRNFAPHWQIPEESATGSASGALVAYLHRYTNLVHGEVQFLQGVAMGSPSLISAHLQDDESMGPLVGGMAKLVSTENITLDC